MMDLSDFQGLPVAGGPRWRAARCFTTTRLGGVSSGPWGTLNLGRSTDDDPSCVRANRQLVVQRLPGPPLWLQQVHGTTVHLANDDPVAAADMPRADAAVTTRRERVLCILTADCLPVVIVDADGSVLGAAHAGWRGLAGGILENTLANMRRLRPAQASWAAWIGPGISQTHFEVGDDVRAAFCDNDAAFEPYFAAGAAPGKWQADLPGIARHRLMNAGVQTVVQSGLCTYARSDLFFSYRRQAQTGRLATFAWLDER